MLRNRSRAVTSKQALMADQTSMISPTKSPPTPISSFLASPRLFNGLLAEPALTSPTSILDSKNSPSFLNPFGYDRNLSKPTTPTGKRSETEAIGLALIDSLNEERSDGHFSKAINRMVLLGSKLKVQIPAIIHSSLESPKSPADFGIKTRSSSQFLTTPLPETPSRDFTRQLSLKEMELSEDYTCVITHGPNAKTIHIFDDCIVESCCGEDAKISDQTSVACHTCKDRGERAICSHEWQIQEMSEGIKNAKRDDAS